MKGRDVSSFTNNWHPNAKKKQIFLQHITKEKKQKKSVMDITTYNDIGQRPYDEDRHGVFKKFAGLAHLTLCLVCDGHGGDQCSIFLLENYPKHLLQIFREQQTTVKEKRKKFAQLLGMALERCIEQWDRLCFKEFYGKIKNDRAKEAFYAQRDEAYWSENGLEAGSTCVAMLIDMRKRRAHTVNLGDSRATWIIGENSSIEQTVDQGVKKDMKPIKGFKFVNDAGRLQNDLAMMASIGDNCLELYGVVSREYGIKTIQFGEKGLRAIIASDGLFDIATNHNVLYEEFPDAKSIADDALQRRQEEVNSLCEMAKMKTVPKIDKFEDNVTIIYVKIPSLHETEEKATSTKEDLQAKLSEAQELFGRFSNLMKELETPESAAAATPTMKPPKKTTSKKSIEKRPQAAKPPLRKQSLNRDVRKVEKDGVTVNFTRKPSRERKT